MARRFRSSNKLLASIEEFENELPVEGSFNPDPEMLDVQREEEESGAALEALIYQLEEAEEALDQLDGVEETLQASVESREGISRIDAKIILGVAHRAMFRIGYEPQATYPAMESYGGTGERIKTTQMALEAVQFDLKAIWEKIKEFLAMFKAKFMEFVKKVAESNVVMLAHAKTVKALVERTAFRGEPKSGTVEAPEAAALYGIDHDDFHGDVGKKLKQQDMKTLTASLLLFNVGKKVAEELNRQAAIRPYGPANGGVFRFSPDEVSIRDTYRPLFGNTALGPFLNGAKLVPDKDRTTLTLTVTEAKHPTTAPPLKTLTKPEMLAALDAVIVMCSNSTPQKWVKELDAVQLTFQSGMEKLAREKVESDSNAVLKGVNFYQMTGTSVLTGILSALRRLNQWNRDAMTAALQYVRVSGRQYMHLQKADGEAAEPAAA